MLGYTSSITSILSPIKSRQHHVLLKCWECLVASCWRKWENGQKTTTAPSPPSAFPEGYMWPETATGSLKVHSLLSGLNDLECSSGGVDSTRFTKGFWSLSMGFGWVWYAALSVGGFHPIHCFLGGWTDNRITCWRAKFQTYSHIGIVGNWIIIQGIIYYTLW